jgi:Fur family ferric uptake transcriptional regulator
MVEKPSPTPTVAAPHLTPHHLALLLAQWGDYQRRNGLKTTGQRELIVSVFLHSSTHLSIDELLGEVRRHDGPGKKVGYATVYRTIKLLTAAGLAAPRRFNDGQTRYEVSGPETPHHDHLICMHCGLILEFENPEIERLQDSVAEKLGGFRVVQHKLELYGMCPKAQQLPAGRCPNDDRIAEARAAETLAAGEKSAPAVGKRRTSSRS